MKGIEESIDLDIDLQILENNSDDPLDLLSIGSGKQFPEDGDLVTG
jgi:hypothetical protein